MTSADREAAWWPLHAALPLGWTLGQATDDPLAGRWRVTAMSPRPRGRRAKSAHFITGEGRTELDAVRDLTSKLSACGG